MRIASLAPVWIVFGLLAAAVPAGRASLAADNPVGEPQASTSRVECFELRRAADGPPVGYASLHRDESKGGVQLEWQVHFPAAELDIWHVETCSAEGQRWIWRERRARNSRTVVADRTDSGLEFTEWGRPAVLRGKLPAPGACAFPLELEEQLRAEAATPSTIALFDPLANAMESLRVVPVPPPSEQVDPLRCVELLRADGSLAGSWTFLGRELVSFRWQRGGLVAVRIDPESYAARKSVASAAQPQALTTKGQ